MTRLKLELLLNFQSNCTITIKTYAIKGGDDHSMQGGIGLTACPGLSDTEFFSEIQDFDLTWSSWSV